MFLKWLLSTIQAIDTMKLLEAWEHIVALLNLFKQSPKFAATSPGEGDPGDAEAVRAACKSAGVSETECEKAIAACG